MKMEEQEELLDKDNNSEDAIPTHSTGRRERLAKFFGRDSVIGAREYDFLHPEFAKQPPHIQGSRLIRKFGALIPGDALSKNLNLERPDIFQEYSKDNIPNYRRLQRFFGHNIELEMSSPKNMSVPHIDIRLPRNNVTSQPQNIDVLKLNKFFGHNVELTINNYHAGNNISNSGRSIGIEEGNYDFYYKRAFSDNKARFGSRDHSYTETLASRPNLKKSKSSTCEDSCFMTGKRHNSILYNNNNSTEGLNWERKNKYVKGTEDPKSFSLESQNSVNKSSNRVLKNIHSNLLSTNKDFADSRNTTNTESFSPGEHPNFDHNNHLKEGQKKTTKLRSNSLDKNTNIVSSPSNKTDYDSLDCLIKSKRSGSDNDILSSRFLGNERSLGYETFEETRTKKKIRRIFGEMISKDDINARLIAPQPSSINIPRVNKLIGGVVALDIEKKNIVEPMPLWKKKKKIQYVLGNVPDSISF